MKAIIFDLDETLINRTAMMRRFLLVQHERFADALMSEAEVFMETVTRYQKNGYVKKLIAYQGALNELGEKDISRQLLEDDKEYYGFDAETFPGVHDLLEDLSQTFDLAIITNGRSRGQNAKIDCVGIRKYFKVITVSEEEGIKKPHDPIYKACLSRLGLIEEDCVFVGDNPNYDVIKPKEFGMKAIWVRSPHFEEPEAADAVVDAVTEIGPIIKNWV